MTESRRVRKWTAKTRTGCRTCKFRRVKCDETRPICLKCSSTGRDCDGYEVSATTTADIKPRVLLPRQEVAIQNKLDYPLLSLLPYKLDVQEALAFDFFRGHAASSLAGHFSSTVFNSLTLQFSHRQPVILHAVVAVGSMYQARWNAVIHAINNIQDCPRYHVALKHYNTAILSLSKYIQNSPGLSDKACVVLMSCLLFICFEILEGDQKGVLNHLMTGLKILFEQSSRKRFIESSKRIIDIQDPSSDCIHQLSQIYTRLDADSTMFGRRAPYLCPRSFGIWPGLDVGVPSTFESVEEARAHLSTLTSISLGFRGELLKAAEQRFPIPDENSTDWAAYYCQLHSKIRRMPFDSDLDSRRAPVLKWFQSWYFALDELEKRLGRSQITLMLRIQSFYPWFITATLRDTRACDCDRFDGVFQNVVDLASEYVAVSRQQKLDFTFALESGILSSLYMLGIKCRTTSIRKKAISLLSQHTVQEGLHKGQMYANLCQEFTKVEEGRARKFLGIDHGEVHFLPEEARFIDVVFGVDAQRPDAGRLVCSRFTDEGSNEVDVFESRFEISNVACITGAGIEEHTVR